MEMICSKCGHSQKYNSKQIKLLREKLKISQSEIARKLKIPQQTVSRLERGNGNSSFFKIVKIIRFLENIKEG